jgi:peptide/nickel transport system permease protein
MQGYIIRRLLYLIPTMFIVTLIVFLLSRFIPGSAIDLIAAQASEGMSEIDRATIEHTLGLDVPVYVQYGRWVSNILLHGDLGVSLYKGIAVWPEVVRRFPVTIELGLLSLIISLFISIPIGLISALRQDTGQDYIMRTISILLISIPGFWIGTVIMIYPSLWWNWSPPMELVKFTDNPMGNIGMFLLPAAVMGAHLSGLSMRVMRTQMLEVLRQDYIRTAWAKGLNEKVVVFRHAAKNALIPVITVIGGQIPMLLGGTVIMEQIFNIPGLGRLMFQALTQRDYPYISAINLVLAFIVMIVNLFVDVSYGWFDPRIKYK